MLHRSAEHARRLAGHVCAARQADAYAKSRTTRARLLRRELPDVLSMRDPYDDQLNAVLGVLGSDLADVEVSFSRVGELVAYPSARRSAAVVIDDAMANALLGRGARWTA